VELSKREKYYAYIRMIERDFPKMIDQAIPLDGLGIVNVNCVRYILEALHYDHGVFHTKQNKVSTIMSHENTIDLFSISIMPP